MNNLALGNSLFLSALHAPAAVIQSLLDIRSIILLKNSSNVLKETVIKFSKVADSIWLERQKTITLGNLRERCQQSASTKKVKFDFSNRNIIDDELQSIITRFPNAIEMNIEACRRLTDKGLSHLQRLPQLTSLNLKGCYPITDEGLVPLQGLNQLTSLNLSGCDKITNEGLAHLQELQQLTSLNL
jgi:hypothetical protein